MSRRSRAGLAKTFGSAMRALLGASAGLSEPNGGVVPQHEALLAPGPSIHELEAERGLARAGSELEPVAQARLDGAPFALRARNNAAYTEVRGEGKFGTHLVQDGCGWPRSIADNDGRKVSIFWEFKSVFDLTWVKLRSRHAENI